MGIAGSIEKWSTEDIALSVREFGQSYASVADGIIQNDVNGEALLALMGSNDEELTKIFDQLEIQPLKRSCLKLKLEKLKLEKSSPSQSKASTFISPSKGNPNSYSNGPWKDNSVMQQLANLISSEDSPPIILMNSENIKTLSAEKLSDKMIKHPTFMSKEDAFSQIFPDVCYPQVDPAQLEIVRSHFAVLDTDAESKLQCAYSFQRLLQFFGYIDVSSREELYSLPSTDSSADPSNASRVIRRKGKPDGISSFGPLYLELKGTKQINCSCLLQGIERILASRLCYGLFRRHLCFIREHSLCFIVYFDLNVDSTENPQQLPLKIFQVEKDSFNELFISVSSIVSTDSSVLFHSYSWLLLKMLNELKLKWCNCQLVLISASSSKVFHAIIGDEAGEISHSNVSLDRRSFIIKFNEEESRYRREKQALSLVSRHHEEHLSSDHYSLGFCQVNSTQDEDIPFTVFTEKKKIFFDSFAPVFLEDIDVEFENLAIQPKPSQSPKVKRITLESLSLFSEKTLIPFDPKSLHETIAMNYPDLISKDRFQKLYQIVPGKRWFNFSTLRSQPTKTTSFQGAIVSRFGRPITAIDQTFYDQTIESIIAFHDCGLVHTDLRSSNILFFPFCEKYLVNDFDLSLMMEGTSEGAMTKIVFDSPQYKDSPRRIKQKLEHSSEGEVFWTKADDLLMFTEYYLRKQSGK